MTSYLVDVILLLALLVTTFRVTKMHHELKQLRSDQGDFCNILGEAAESFDTIVKTVSDLNHNGSQLIGLLGAKIDEAREVIAEFDRRRAAQRADRGESENPRRETVTDPR
jgi:hypothetical protein